MAKNTDERKARAVPSSRIGRVGRLGALAGKIAGNVVTNGASQWIKGERPALSALLLTPKKYYQHCRSARHHAWCRHEARSAYFYGYGRLFTARTRYYIS